MVHTWDFLGEFAALVRRELVSWDQEEQDNWRERSPAEQERRARKYCFDQFDRSDQTGEPVNWAGIFCVALEGWIRDNHLELFTGIEGADVPRKK